MHLSFIVLSGGAFWQETEATIAPSSTRLHWQKQSFYLTEFRSCYSHQPMTTPAFCEVKLVIVSKNSGGFGEMAVWHRGKEGKYSNYHIHLNWTDLFKLIFLLVSLCWMIILAYSVSVTIKPSHGWRETSYSTTTENQTFPFRFLWWKKLWDCVCSTHSDIRVEPPSVRQRAARAGRCTAERSARSDHLQCCVCTHTSHEPERDRKREGAH